jgi:hypothetical protein
MNTFNGLHAPDSAGSGLRHSQAAPLAVHRIDLTRCHVSGRAPTRAMAWLGAGLLLISWLFCFQASAEAAPLMLSRWAATVSPTNVHSEYPRPQFVRPEWQNLNGLWDYTITSDTRRVPESFAGKILVPFPVESYLSGVQKRLDEQSTLWYRRKFTVPAGWQGRRVLLHFGAVDWAATVHLNGHVLGSHRGGYDEFTFDLTPFLHWHRQNELIVAVQDPTEGDQPRGKQSRKPEGIFYTPSSGIWQTVWLEPVPAESLAAIRLTPDLNNGEVRVTALANTLASNVTVEVVARIAGQEAGRATGPVGGETTVALRQIQPWSPADPQLYDATVTLRADGVVLDTVETYFGLREVRVASDERGLRRIFLNGKPLFQIGVLDQGFWPDGLYTAPSDEALRFDLEMAKQLGFNLVRKHVKVEPARWYYWADKLGLLVWQDMPSGNNATEAGRRSFRMELERMMDQRFNHPSIVMWVLFNEGWGQFDTERLVAWMKAADPTRLVNNASGWTDAKVGDVLDAHSYPDPLVPTPDAARTGVLGEFGGLGLGIEGHKWSDQTWWYQGQPDAKTLTSRYGALLQKVWELQKLNGLAAAVYTQLTDVETECNGFFTYDREVLKMDADRVRRANEHHPVVIAGEMLLPSALQGEYKWRYTTAKPAAEWMTPVFDDSSWPEGVGGFGVSGTPGALWRTPWKTSDIWLRREFTLPESLPSALSLVIHHDEDAEVYLNGVLAARLEGYAVGYEITQIRPEALAALKPGRNVMAIHCHQSTGGQYIDAGLLGETTKP